MNTEITRKRMELKMQKEIERTNLLEHIDVLNEIKPIDMLPKLDVMTIHMVAKYFEVSYNNLAAKTSLCREELERHGFKKVYPSDFLEAGYKWTKYNNGSITSFIYGSEMIFVPKNGLNCFTEESLFVFALILNNNDISKELRNRLGYEITPKASSDEITVSEMNRIDAEVSNSMQVFNNAEFGQVRTVIINGEPWFVGKDVAEALGYSNASKAVINHVDDEDKQFMMIDIAHSHFGNVPVGQSKTTIINESGMYSLIMSSKLPSAKKFKHWVTSEVLPALRKTGSYSTPQKIENILLSDEFISLLVAKLQDTQPKIHDYSQQFSDTNAKIDKMYSDMGKLANVILDMKDKYSDKQTTSVSSKDSISVLDESLKWKKEIYASMDVLISNKKFSTRAEVMNYLYKYMNTKYGIVWEQEIREYQQKNNSVKKPFTIDVVYENEMYRSIFSAVLNDLVVDCKSPTTKSDSLHIIIKPLIEKNNDKSKYGMATYKMVYAEMERCQKINWAYYKTRCSVKTGNYNPSKKDMIITSPKLLKKFKNSVDVLICSYN